MATQILLLDDEKEFSDALAERLQLRGYGVSIAYDGTTALQTIAQQTPDIILMDWMMPGINKTQLLEALRQQAPTTPIIVMTGQELESCTDAERAILHCEATAYLTKPVTFSCLIETITQAHTPKAHS